MKIYHLQVFAQQKHIKYYNVKREIINYPKQWRQRLVAKHLFPFEDQGLNIGILLITCILLKLPKLVVPRPTKRIKNRGN